MRNFTQNPVFARMNFQYSYRAFLITSLLTGSLVLFLYSLKLSNSQVQSQEETYDVVLAPEEPQLDEKDLATLVPVETKIETNRAYNEAEKYISSVENENQEITETFEGKLQAMDQALTDSNNNDIGNESLALAKPKGEKNKKLSNSESKKESQAIVKGGNRNTTISYRLVDRKDLALPNPVYTCSGSGKVVINIEVDHLGKVNKSSYNKNASTTLNACLIDAALSYSAQARFSTDASRPKQLGTISFNFPGQ